MQDDLSNLRDDMIAFIEGHGMRRFHGFVDEDVQSVIWKPRDADGWKDFVELAKSGGAPFLTMDESVLEREELDSLTRRLGNGEYVNEEDVEEARYLHAFIGKTGFIQLGFPWQGTVFLYEISTMWYDRYQRLLDVAEDFGGFSFDELEDDEH